MPARRTSPYLYLAEDLLDHPTVIQAVMFGCDVFYLHGRLQIVLPPGLERDWRGVLFPCGREAHASLLGDYPQLRPHAQLRKWLYIEEEQEDFEQTVTQMVYLILSDDLRLGVVPKEKRRRKTKLRN